MMKYVDSISRYVDPLVYQYIITTSRLYTEDVTIRPFAYSFDVFIRCNNIRRVTDSDALSVSITTLSATSIPTLYHSSIKFSPILSTSVQFLLYLLLTLNLASYSLLYSLFPTSLGNYLIQSSIILLLYFLIKGTILFNTLSANQIHFTFLLQNLYLLMLPYILLHFITLFLLFNTSYHNRSPTYLLLPI